MTRPAASNIAEPQASADAAFIGIAKVRQLTGLSKSTISRRMAAKQFPLPVLQERDKEGRIYLTRWDLAEILAWRAAQFAKRDERQAVAA